LAQWEFEHIADSDPVARSHREEEARRLALRCREDAGKAGISSQDLEAAAEGNLIGNMLQALDENSGRCTAMSWLTKKKIERVDLNP
jgi:regulator of sirC expression with transglutaminase-like and TPR domain